MSDEEEEEEMNSDEEEEVQVLHELSLMVGSIDRVINSLQSLTQMISPEGILSKSQAVLVNELSGKPVINEPRQQRGRPKRIKVVPEEEDESLDDDDNEEGEIYDDVL